ncbi:facilitated trehalose transporter Tret1-like [Palaemon carinicauda]|uniref:facilitated trehalose transporter Tret1-like n=1 Tax=Palaemon carinicauda TaxID=392227 RepID=UPI0035B5CF21
MSQKADDRLEVDDYSPRETVQIPAEKSLIVESSSLEKDDLASTEHSPVLLPQILGGGVSALVQVGLGMVGGYSGVTIPQLTSNNSTTNSGIVFDDHQVALFSSLVYLTATAGCLIGILPMVRYGQRTTMLLCLPILLVGWITLSVSTTIAMIQASRCLVGLTIGVIEGASYQYTTEISHSSIRGMMVGALDTMRQLGVLLVYSLGATTLSWQQISLVCGCTTVPPVFIALIFLPNSPRWLVTQGRMKEASKSLAFYRGTDNINVELTSISRQVEAMSGKTNLNFGTQLKVILQRKTMKVMVFLTFLFLAAQFTGNIVVLAYIVPILEVANISMNSYVAAMVVGGIRVLGTICSLFFVDYFGRKPALFVSFLVCGTSLTGLGIFFFIKSRYDNVQGIDWMPLTCLVFFTFFTCVAHPTLNLVRGELLPTTVRSAAMPFLCSVLFGGLFLASQTFPVMTTSLGTYGTFWMYGAMCILVLAVTILVIPETLNENLENITLERRKR